MLTSVALVVCHVRVVGCPWLTVLGFAESEAVGAVGDGGGVGGGGAAFFAHAPRNISAPNAATRPHILIWCFTSSSKCLCARLVACDLRNRGGAHVCRPRRRNYSKNESTSQSKTLPSKNRRRRKTQSTSNSS